MSLCMRRQHFIVSTPMSQQPVVINILFFGSLYELLKLLFIPVVLNADTCTHIVMLCICNKTWADAFRGEPELKEFVAVYEELKEKGCEFPMTDLDNIPPIHTPARVTNACIYYLVCKCTHGFLELRLMYTYIDKQRFTYLLL